jgi:CBS domain-containing protein
MHRTLVRDVMTTDVASVDETATYKEIVTTMALRQVSGIPVVDAARRPIGIVSETDLLAKEADPNTDATRPLLRSPRRHAIRRKAAAIFAASLMTPRPLTITADQPAAEAARRMQRHRVNRLPVVDDRGKLIGIVSRGDVLRAFLQSDDELRRRIREEVLRQDWWLEPSDFLVTVDDGIVTISGELELESQVEPLCRAIAAVDGVVRVGNCLTWRLSERDARQGITTSVPWSQPW